MTDLSRILAEHGLTVQVAFANDNPVMPNPVAGMTHWEVVVEGGTAPVAYTVSILREGADPAPPLPGEALDLLQADLAHPDLHADDADWLARHGVEDGTPQAQAWLAARDHIQALLGDVLTAFPGEVVEALLGRGRVASLAA